MRQSDHADPLGRRLQWGHDKRDVPMAAVPTGITERRVAAGRTAVVITIVAWVTYCWICVVQEFIDGQAASTRSRVEAICYLVLVTLLTSSSLAYLICRLGFFYRARAHRRTPRLLIDELFDQRLPRLTVIVPSYREEERVVRTTLLSAALQSYPGMRIVLLIDDPPDPKKRSDLRLLQAARRLPHEVEEVLAGPRARFHERYREFQLRRTDHNELTVRDMLELAGTIEEAISWLNGLATSYQVVDHADAFFRDYVVCGLAASFAVDSTAIRAAAGQGVVLPPERFAHFYRRLFATFDAELSFFERKQYVTLSHEPNKAMNLNSYIGLMGNRYRDVDTSAGRMLIPTAEPDADLVVENPDYVLTLDADSILLPEYCERLIHRMEQSGNSRVAVIQTPYSSYPGCATRLERIAGATTDLQHIVHQGLAHYDAVFWVGANAILRKAALDDIAEVDYVDNFEIRRYIRDRTVIEDTESTIDLNIHDWTLVNYPERLSYSATPPDFGSLCIQRRRWANGGLIILPKLWRQVRARRARAQRTRFSELFLRANYMASICWTTLSLIVLLAYPFGNSLVMPLLGVMALPYFAAMASDLKHCGYKRTDVLRIYGFNLVLLIVNLAGVGASLVQAITGDKSAFGRTPKVRRRTATGLMFVVAPYLLVGLAAFTFLRDYEGRRWDNAVYAALNGTLTVYAIVAFIGIRHSLADIWAQIVVRLYKPEKPSRSSAVKPSTVLANPAVADWASILQLNLVRSAGAPAPLPSRPALEIVGSGTESFTAGTAGTAAPASPDHLSGDLVSHLPTPPAPPLPSAWPSRRQARQRILNEDDVAALSHALGNEAVIAHLLVFCGLRWSEFVALKAGDVDLPGMALEVRGEIAHVDHELVYRSRPHACRRIPIPPHMLAELEHRVVACLPHDLLFEGPGGGVLDKREWSERVFEEALRKVPHLLGLKVHDLRHTFAANAVRAGANLEELRARLGHRTVHQTLRLYGHLLAPLQVASGEGR